MLLFYLISILTGFLIGTKSAIFGTLLIIIIHEFGHAFVGLGDEYYSSAVAYEDFYNLEIEPWEPNLTTLVDFEKKWKGMMDESTPVPTPRTAENENKIGVFEGGGYVTKGVYSPYQDCKMKSNKMKHFCPVCEKATEEMILFHIGE